MGSAGPRIEQRVNRLFGELVSHFRTTPRKCSQSVDGTCYDAPMTHPGLLPSKSRLLAARLGRRAALGAVLTAISCAPSPALRSGETPPPLRVLVGTVPTPLIPGLGGDPDRDIARNVAASLGRSVQFVAARAEQDAITLLLEGGVDIIATGMAPNREHLDRIAFSLPYRHEDHPVVLGLRAGDVELRRCVNEVLTSRAFADGHAVHRDDLKGIRRRGSLRMIARPHVGSYFLHRGDPRGFEYELLKRFADEQGLALEVVIPKSVADLESWLLSGRGDVLAANPEGTPAASGKMQPTRPIANVDLVVVARDDDSRPIEDLAQLAGRTLTVRPTGTERRVADEIAAAVEGLRVNTVSENVSIIDLLAGVADGHYDLTLAPQHLVRVEQAAGHRLESVLTLGSTPLSWGVRASNRQLRAALDDFLAREFRGVPYNVLWHKYLRSGAVLTRAGRRSDRLASISPYDAIVRRYAAANNVDWRLVVAMMYQESRFEPGLVSPAGATGLMQILPETGAELGAVDLYDPEESIRAGTLYLSRLTQRWDPRLPLSTRLRFALASYDAGIAHVLDARALAREMGWSADRWYGNVERAMLLLEQPAYAEKAKYGYCRGSETVHYVEEIDRRYRLYIQNLPEDTDADVATELASPLPPA